MLGELFGGLDSIRADRKPCPLQFPKNELRIDRIVFDQQDTEGLAALFTFWRF
ncbi:MAG: hypothetical protein ACRD88_04895 [Terriglobia bacterium]